MRISYWSSDVCSSDLPGLLRRPNALQCISSRRRAEVFNMAFLDLLLPRRKHDPAHSRAETGPRVDWPARRIEPATDRGDLAISDKQRQVLRQLSAPVPQRPRSPGRWQIFGPRRGYRPTHALSAGATASYKLPHAG